MFSFFKNLISSIGELGRKWRRFIDKKKASQRHWKNREEMFGKSQMRIRIYRMFDGSTFATDEEFDQMKGCNSFLLCATGIATKINDTWDFVVQELFNGFESPRLVYGDPFIDSWM